MTERVLVENYLAFAYGIASHYFLPGSDPEDVRQEAAGALIVAARTYREGAGSFGAFAAVVIRRRLFDLMTSEQRDRRRANHLTIQDMPLEESDGDSLISTLPAQRSDPSDIYEARERFRGFTRSFAALSKTERDALLLVYDGHTYAQRPDSKSIDNAVQRARRKLRDAA